MATNRGEGKLNLKPAVLCLKNEPCVTSCGGGVGGIHKPWFKRWLLALINSFEENQIVIGRTSNNLNFEVNNDLSKNRAFLDQFENTSSHLPVFHTEWDFSVTMCLTFLSSYLYLIVSADFIQDILNITLKSFSVVGSYQSKFRLVNSLGIHSI